VIRTKVGYSGGKAANPDYHNIGDHSEAIRIEFDPQQLSYTDLLAVFWESHDPTYQVWSRQYRNAIFALNETQKRLAEESRARLAGRSSEKILTAIEPAGEFYPAEDYHQKYLLRRAEGIFRELRAIYPDEKQFAASTAAARLNGYLGCNGDGDLLEQEIDRLGLSRPMQEQLVKYVSSSCSQFRGLTCPSPR